MRDNEDKKGTLNSNSVFLLLKCNDMRCDKDKK